MRPRLQYLALAGASLIALGAGQARASGTVAGTSVNNTATVGYSIGGVSQPTVSSNQASFLVDRKANVVVAQVGGAATMTSYGSTNQVVTYTVTNTTNATQDFRLVGTNALVTSTTSLNHTDTIGVSNIRVYVDSNGNGVYDQGVDTATYIDELGPDQSKTVFIVADLPSTGPAGGVAGVNLTAVLATGGTSGSLGADLTQSLVDDPTKVDTVFADGGGSIDVARDGMFSANGEFDIYGVSASVNKTFRVVSDPLNGLVAPKAIPGAVLEYCIAVTNTGAQNITNVNVNDNIPQNTTYLSGSIFSGGTTLSGVCNIDGAAVSDASGFNSSSNSISTSIATLAPAATTTTRFRVTVN